MGNHLESCREDCLFIQNLFRGKEKIYVETVSDCSPYEEIKKFTDKKCFNPNDLFIIHYSGHGNIIGKKIDGRVRLLSTWNDSNGKYIDSYNVDKLLSTINCKILLLTDSCYSGAFGDHFKGNNILICIGSSDITKRSTEYSFQRDRKTGILVNLLKIFFDTGIENMEKEDYYEILKNFINDNRIKIKPFIKIIEP